MAGELEDKPTWSGLFGMAPDFTLGGEVEVEFVDLVQVALFPHGAQRLWTCSRCCALVREDYQEGHRKWHQEQ